MWVPKRLWAMLVLLLVEPWSTGHHHPYHHSPKLRKIQRPRGARLHLWTIQRLGNCANTQRSTATSLITNTYTLILLSTNLWYRKNKAAADVKAQRLSRLASPLQSHPGSIRPYRHFLPVFTAMKNTTLTSCFQLHDSKKTQTHTGSVLTQRLLFQNMIEILGRARKAEREWKREVGGK